MVLVICNVTFELHGIVKTDVHVQSMKKIAIQFVSQREAYYGIHNILRIFLADFSPNTD
jgi:hypothetical protein